MRRGAILIGGALAALIAIGCGGEAAEQATQETPGVDEEVVAPGDTAGAVEPDLFPDPIETDACALASTEAVTELTGLEADSLPAGDVYVETYGARTATCEYGPDNPQVAAPLGFFSYTIQHPIDVVPGVNEAVLNNPNLETIEETDGDVLLVNDANDVAYAKIGRTLIELHCESCDLGPAIRTLAENYRGM